MQRWTVHLEGGPKRVNHAAVAIGDKIFSFGGYCTGEDYKTTRPMDVYVLDTISLRWRVLPIVPASHPDYPCIPYQRYSHTAVAVGDCAYIWGGRNGKDGACETLYQFDSTTNRWSRPVVYGNIPGARDGHSACVINNKMYIYGGFEVEVDRFFNDVHAFDFNTMTWMEVKTLGRPACWRDFHTATAVGSTMFVFGGRSDEGGDLFTNNEIYCNKMQTFNTLTNTWHEPVTHGDKPPGRRSHSSFMYCGMLYVFGGYNGLYDCHYNDVHKFDPEQMRWSCVKVWGQGPCPRRRQCCCMIGEKVYLFGGTSPKSPEAGTRRNQLPLLESDLIDHSDLHILDFAPSLKTLCEIFVLNLKLDTSCLPVDIRWELAAMTTNNTISRSCNTNG
ncbi:kelch domain-containing protein 3-like [Gigantopelta aegis]|uniref:kelch domain-containing protein 3-like n=1 Tax=Gigantopelta aegis TaxID=1735272 RepID=UPI001B887FE3|nr:kelch domain-containing protein 3-like [Gigantopelta aegis]